MKILKCYRSGSDLTVKCLGATLLKRYTDPVSKKRIQNLFGTFFTSFKEYNLSDGSVYKQVKICGIKVLQRVEKEDFCFYKIFSFFVIKKSLVAEFKKKYLKLFDSRFDDIYILKSNSGEIYLFLAYLLDALIEKNKSKSPLIVATKKYHLDLIKMICPDINHIYLSNLKLKFSSCIFSIKNFRFFILFSDSHFFKFEKSLRLKEQGSVHYFNSLATTLKLEKNNFNFSPRSIKIASETNLEVEKKASSIGLNLNNFVYLIPEAKTFKIKSSKFWTRLCELLEQKGYDIFFNSFFENASSQFQKKYKHLHLSFDEAFCLVKRAKKVVALRCGFIEYLLQTKTPMDVLYTDYLTLSLEKLDSSKSIAAYSLKPLVKPESNFIREIDCSKLSDEQCLNTICNDM